MTIKTIYSNQETIEQSVAELSASLKGFSTRLLVFFASSKFEPERLAQALSGQFAQAELIGCTTAGEIASGQMLKNSIVAMAFDAEALEDFAIGVVEDVAGATDVARVFAQFSAHVGHPMLGLDPTEYVGVVLVDGLSVAEEKLMDRIGDLTDVTFIGGSAGDDLKFVATHVFAKGKALRGAAVLALLKPKRGFELIKTESFTVKNTVLKATRVDEAKRVVYEFDHEPALQAYARALGVPPAEAASRFMTNPLGLVIEGKPFVRSPQRVQDQALVFYCNIREGMVLHVLESGDIVQDTRAIVDARRRENGGLSGLINFHCILRTLELEQRGQTEAYGKIFADVPTVGFSTYGEEYLGHVNQTSTMLLFK